MRPSGDPAHRFGRRERRLGAAHGAASENVRRRRRVVGDPLEIEMRLRRVESLLRRVLAAGGLGLGLGVMSVGKGPFPLILAGVQGLGATHLPAQQVALHVSRLMTLVCSLTTSSSNILTRTASEPLPSVIVLDSTLVSLPDFSSGGVTAGVTVSVLVVFPDEISSFFWSALISLAVFLCSILMCSVFRLLRLDTDLILLAKSNSLSSVSPFLRVWLPILMVFVMVIVFMLIDLMSFCNRDLEVIVVSIVLLLEASSFAVSSFVEEHAQLHLVPISVLKAQDHAAIAPPHVVLHFVFSLEQALMTVARRLRADVEAWRP